MAEWKQKIFKNPKISPQKFFLGLRKVEKLTHRQRVNANKSSGNRFSKWTSRNLLLIFTFSAFLKTWQKLGMHILIETQLVFLFPHQTSFDRENTHKRTRQQLEVLFKVSHSHTDYLLPHKMSRLTSWVMTLVKVPISTYWKWGACQLSIWVLAIEKGERREKNDRIFNLRAEKFKRFAFWGQDRKYSWLPASKHRSLLDIINIKISCGLIIIGTKCSHSKIKRCKLQLASFWGAGYQRRKKDEKEDTVVVIAYEKKLIFHGFVSA